MDNKLHIVHTEASCGWGGQEIRILNESLGMLDRGHRITLLTPKSAKIHQAARDAGIRVEAMPFEKKSIGGVLELSRWLRENAVDVINTHSSIDSWLTGLATLFPSNRHLPVLRTRHISAPVNQNFATRWLYLSSAKRVVTTGERLRLDLIDRLQGNGDHFISIPTGVNLERFNPATVRPRNQMRSELGIGEDAFVVGIIATLRSWKGHDYLLDAIEALIPAMPNLHLVIAGDGPRKKRIQERIETNGLKERIHMLGQRSDVEDLLGMLDIFVLPSYANEGVPQAVMQAMAMQLPVISTDIGAIGEAVIHDRTGIMVEPESGASISNAIQKLATDPQLRTELGENARAHIVQRFSFDGMIEGMEQVFAQLTGNT